ncbi:FadR/GntR family transcriptional regulator [Priestia sp. 40]|uniref:FadR/GntR family transcriptional regulator n=1 Tax=Priestia sp. 40 TaxID=3394459 RepID=UPI003BF6E06E
MSLYQPIKKTTITEQVMERIASLITSGQLKEGEQLPNERSLAEMYNVSRGRVREALRSLSLIGFIEIRPGEGNFVRRNHSIMPSQTVTLLFYQEQFNIEEVYRARKLIELEVYMLAIDKLEVKNIKDLNVLIENLKTYPRSDVKGFVDLIDKMDFYLGEITENKVFFKLMQTIIHLRRETYEKLIIVEDSWDFAIKQRTELVKSFKSKDKKQLQEVLDYIYLESKNFYKDIN